MRQALENLPPVAAPIAFTLAGGVALVAVVASVLAGDPARETSVARAVDLAQSTSSPTSSPAPAAALDTPEASTSGDARPAEPPSATAQAPSVTVADLAAMKLPDDQPPSSAHPPAELTASIPPARPGGTFVPVVPIAETQEEVEALEAIQRQEVEEDIGAPSQEATAAIEPATPAMVAATTNKWVNMRSGPSDESEVLEVVPALAAIQAEAACNWCVVSYEGRQGYIYKSFLSYEDTSGE